MIKGVIRRAAFTGRVLLSIGPFAYFKRPVIHILFLFLSGGAAAQTCTVINSIPATPPASGSLDLLYAARDSSNYAVAGTIIFDNYDINGKGSYTTVPATNNFWNNTQGSTNGPLQRTGVWAASNPLTLGFSACVTVPDAKDYYVGLAADNSGTLLVDGKIIVQGVGFMYWSIFRVPLTKGKHLLEYHVVNFQAEAALGFEIYNNTKEQILNAQSYGDLDLIFSTLFEIGAPVEEGDPATSYSCPVGYIQDYCVAGKPICSQFVPINLVINNPPPACSSSSVDITSPQVTAGSPSSLVYTYWKDSLATMPLDNPDKVTQSGTYYIMGNSNGCYQIKPVTVVVSSISAAIAKTICPGNNYLGHNKSGSYVDTLTASNGCDSLVTIDLIVLPSVNLGKDRVLCLGDSIVLTPGNYSSYLWQDNTTAPQYVVRAPGTYSVRVMDENGCSSSDTVVVKGINCSLSNIPNTFTPNGDGINDTWNVSGLKDFPLCNVFIYSRTGQLVFSSVGYAKPWDGRRNGEDLPVGTYYYIIDLKNDKPKLSGFVALIR